MNNCTVCPRNCAVDRIPFVYNSNGYDALPSLAMMDELIDIYMPDLKYADDALGLSKC